MNCLRISGLDSTQLKKYKKFYLKDATELMQWAQQMKRAANDIRFKDIYTLGKRLGQGKFATVFECLNIATKSLAAVKVIDKKLLT